MATIIDPPNSVWPNGLKVDSEGYVTFYPLGTNKVDISTITWPDGDTLISPFVYENNKLVGFVDTKALTVSKNTAIYLPYTHIEAEFSAIDKGQLQIHAPKATTKKASWMNSEKEDIPEAQFKYKGCTTVDDVKTVDANYQTTDIIDGTWSEPLWDLEQSSDGTTNGGMFYNCDDMTVFKSDLLSLTDGSNMFRDCDNLKTFNSELSSLTDGSYMFYNCKNLTSFSSDSSGSPVNLSSLTDGSFMFYNCHKYLTLFKSDLPSLTNGQGMFEYCYSLIRFDIDLSNLTNGNGMFINCRELKSFTSDLSSLTDGRYMFDGCERLKSFSSDSSGSPVNLSSLTDGSYMFNDCLSLPTFSYDLPSLTNGHSMFFNCDNLTSFTSDLSSLTMGAYMFWECEKLTSFTSDLSSLENGSWMFYDCKLDTASVQNIADTINTPSTKGTIHIYIGNSTPNEQEETAFNTIASKNWTVYVGVNDGSPSEWNPTSLIPIDGEETTNPIPYWAKPVQSDEKHAKYVDEYGNFFNILGGNYIYGDDLSTYGMFTCEEDAAANMRLTKIEKGDK